MPGFIDMHLHGGGGYDFITGTTEAIEGMSRFHMYHGTTSMVPSTTGMPLDDMFNVLDSYRNSGPFKNCAQIAGVHLEGPFISPHQAGAMKKEFITRPCGKDIQRIISFKDIVARVTAAPETKGVLELSRILSRNGILMSIGHSNGTCEDALKALENGFTHITHMYSALSHVKRVSAFRIGGIVESAYLNDEFTVEVIGDGCHLPPELLKLIYKVKGASKTALITDCIKVAGTCRAGEAEGTGGKRIIIEDGVAKLPDRSAFAGSICTMDRAVKNMVNLAQVPLQEVVKMATATPARILGINSKGILCRGMDADIVIMDKNFNVRAVMIEGEMKLNRLCSKGCV
jgi:N-acetylglucosamine-6-phosphate deacetylase